ncbi:hypothetical protein BLOT_010663 [Blomia tropicalis]|nr:hypothetical protein BLOT_010663 [Blomia tropicalis]
MNAKEINGRLSSKMCVTSGQYGAFQNTGRLIDQSIVEPSMEREKKDVSCELIQSFIDNNDCLNDRSTFFFHFCDINNEFLAPQEIFD